MAVFRIYVEKKNKFATEAESLTEDIRSFLEIPGVSSLRIINRYDVEGIDGDLFEKCKDTVFSDPQTDHIYYELPESDHVFAAEYLPGQYDQRADSCAQCIQFISLENRPAVRTAKIYLLFGSVTEKELGTIKDYIINPVERREVSLSAFESLEKPIKEPENVAILRGFRDMKNDEADEFLSSHNLAMDRDDLIFCRGYFISEGRDPSYTEIRMIDTYWSDHCRHTTFLTEIQSASIEDNRVKEAYESYQNMRLELRRENKPVTLMDIATIGAKYLKHKGILTTLDESEEVNACSVKINADVEGKTEPWLLMFKNETHNHPTEIEPFGGASTCLGGAIRDPLSGRSYVYQAMRITGAANPLDPLRSTLPGKLPQRTIVTEAAAGYSSYGNQIGLAAGLVKEIYHPGYAAKRLEMGAVVAATPAGHVVREIPKPGDVIILLGGKTGRDGCGGATGSSKSHDLSSLESGGAEVQKGNAPEERKIQRLFRKKNVARLIKRCNDFGAGGVSVAVGELADSIDIDLDAVPAKYPGLDGTELAISESQERMAVVVSEKDAETFVEQAKYENLEATPIAKVTDTGRVIMFWRGEEIVNLKRSFLDSNGAPKYTDVEVHSPRKRVDFNVTNFINANKRRSDDFQRTLTALQPDLEDLVGNLNYCSQKGLVDIFDSTAGGNTVLMPLGGMYQETPAQAMVSKIPVPKGHTTTCSAASWGFNPYLTEADPYLGSYLAVIDSVSKLVACGGDLDNCWLSFQE
ncbi:MAG TPA: phosphoribosylformylglycinamidine synthase [Anaerovoracaceae bacterium]|nr:phosphoribosylformylglycinamidine synthase [Anaerovoracaceae bacterium]